MKKKRVLIAAIVAFIVVLGGIMLFGFLRKSLVKPIEIDPETKLPTTIEAAEPVYFDTFSIGMQGMTSGRYVAMAGKTDSGAYLEYCVITEFYNSETGKSEENKNTIRRIEGDADFYNTLCKLLGAYKVRKWDGFAGANPPGVLDGSSGSFEAILSDGSKIYAHGSNNFPKNFVSLYDLLRDMTESEQ